MDLFIRLSSHLDAVVDVVIEHPRDGTKWFGAMRDLSEARDALGRLRWPLSSSGGVELTLVTPDDQVSLMQIRDGHIRIRVLSFTYMYFAQVQT